MKSARTTIKWLGNQVLSHAGVQIERVPTVSRKSVLAALLRREGIDLVLDVGANRGQFATFLRTIGYSGKIVSFEPGASEHEALEKRAAKDPNWIIAQRVAIGSKTGEVEFYISKNSVSSSVLPVAKSHIVADEGALPLRTERVAMAPLGDAAAGWVTASSRIFLKIDVQGYEHEVLAGIGRVSKQLRVLELELSVEPLYQGSLTMLNMFSEAERLGFDLYYLEPGFANAAMQKVLQYEGIFVKRPA